MGARGGGPARCRLHAEVTGTDPDSFGPMQQEAVEEEENKRYENEYETARREALGRMKAEEERRQLEDKLQAEALLQQMEELKAQEQEVRAPTAALGCCTEVTWGILRHAVFTAICVLTPTSDCVCILEGSPCGDGSSLLGFGPAV